MTTRIASGAAFGELLAKEYATDAERAQFTDDVLAELATLEAATKGDEAPQEAGVPKAKKPKKAKKR